MEINSTEPEVSVEDYKAIIQAKLDEEVFQEMKTDKLSGIKSAKKLSKKEKELDELKKLEKAFDPKYLSFDKTADAKTFQINVESYSEIDFF